MPIEILLQMKTFFTSIIGIEEYNISYSVCQWFTASDTIEKVTKILLLVSPTPGLLIKYLRLLACEIWRSFVDLSLVAFMILPCTKLSINMLLYALQSRLERYKCGRANFGIRYGGRRKSHKMYSMLKKRDLIKRQAILTIERCVFKNTASRATQSGFEQFILLQTTKLSKISKFIHFETNKCE